MPVRLQVQDKVLFEGESPVPRVGDGIQYEGQVVRVEAVTWDFAGSTATATLVIGDVPYTY